MTHTVGIAEMHCCKDRDEVIVTYALGSCLGITVHDDTAGVGGMVHIMLPLSKMDAEKSQNNPYMFADTGVAELFKKAYSLGASKENIVVKVAGGAQILDTNGHFKIGERNFAMLRKVLWKNNVLIEGQDVGGTISRTMSLHVSTGQVIIRSNGQQKEL